MDWKRELPSALPDIGEVHLWLHRLKPESQTENDALLHLLSNEEQQRYQRFVTPGLKSRFLKRRLMIRQTLSHRFVTNTHGRPEIHPEQTHNDLHFNLSHSADMAILAIARRYEVGVDIEYSQVTQDSNHLEVAENYFTRDECRWIFDVNPDQRLSRFFDLWTLKESYIKARGIGLSLPLHHFQFSVTPTRSITLDECCPASATGKNWQFALGEPAEHYRHALALQGNKEQALRIRTYAYSDANR